MISTHFCIDIHCEGHVCIVHAYAISDFRIISFNYYVFKVLRRGAPNASAASQAGGDVQIEAAVQPSIRKPFR
jgi:hypothetical protein